MLLSSVHQDRNGDWVWEVVDDDVIYCRSLIRFSTHWEAANDLKKECHLILGLLKIA
ncbi:hypothetical protein [Sphingomonas oryzagri]